MLRENRFQLYATTPKRPLSTVVYPLNTFFPVNIYVEPCQRKSENVLP